MESGRMWMEGLAGLDSLERLAGRGRDNEEEEGVVFLPNSFHWHDFFLACILYHKTNCY